MECPPQTTRASERREVLAVGRAIEAAFDPVKLGDDVLGNFMPDLHTARGAIALRSQL